MYCVPCECEMYYCLCYDSDRILAWHFILSHGLVIHHSLSLPLTFFLSMHFPSGTRIWSFLKQLIYPHTSLRQSIFPIMAKRCYILLLLLCAWCTDCSPSLLQVNFSALSIYVFRMHASCVGVCLFDLSCLNVFLSIDCLDLTLNVVYDIDSLRTTFVFV